MNHFFLDYFAFAHYERKISWLYGGVFLQSIFFTLGKITDDFL